MCANACVSVNECEGVVGTQCVLSPVFLSNHTRNSYTMLVLIKRVHMCDDVNVRRWHITAGSEPHACSREIDGEVFEFSCGVDRPRPCTKMEGISRYPPCL